MHVGEPVVATGEAIRESRVIDAQQVERGRVEIVDVQQPFRGAADWVPENAAPASSAAHLLPRVFTVR